MPVVSIDCPSDADLQTATEVLRDEYLGSENPAKAKRCRRVADWLAGDAAVTATQWEEHTPGFASLMLGRILLAQVSRSPCSDVWFCHLSFITLEEWQSTSVPTEAEARDLCENHARKVLS